MSTMKIELQIDCTNIEHLKALNVMVKALGEGVGMDYSTGAAVKAEQAAVPDKGPTTGELKRAEAKVVDLPKQEIKESEISEEQKDQNDEYLIEIQGWSEKQMRGKDTAELKEACEFLGIDFEALPGVNTNKKLRDLILDHFMGSDALKETKAKTTPAKEETPAEGGATIDDVRKAVTANVATHRDAIKTKLTELGANNVTSLDPSKFQEFLDFIDLL